MDVSEVKMCARVILCIDTDAPFEERVVADVINVAQKLENTMQPVLGLSFYAYRPRSVEACFVREVRQRWGLASLYYFFVGVLMLRYTHIPTPLDDSTRPLDNSTHSTLHNPQELALW